jgi:hypothetical protein
MTTLFLPLLSSLLPAPNFAPRRLKYIKRKGISNVFQLSLISEKTRLNTFINCLSKQRKKKGDDYREKSGGDESKVASGGRVDHKGRLWAVRSRALRGEPPQLIDCGGPACKEGG